MFLFSNSSTDFSLQNWNNLFFQNSFFFCSYCLQGEISLPLDLADFHPVTKSVTDWHRWWKSVKSVEILIPGIKRHRCIIHTAVWKLNLLRWGKFHTDWQQRGKSNYSHCQRESSRNSQNLWTFAIYSRNEWESSNSMVKGWCNAWMLIKLNFLEFYVNEYLKILPLSQMNSNIFKVWFYSG